MENKNMENVGNGRFGFYSVAIYVVTRFITIPFADKIDPDTLAIGVVILFFIFSYGRMNGRF